MREARRTRRDRSLRRRRAARRSASAASSTPVLSSPTMSRSARTASCSPTSRSRAITHRQPRNHPRRQRARHRRFRLSLGRTRHEKIPQIGTVVDRGRRGDRLVRLRRPRQVRHHAHRPGDQDRQPRANRPQLQLGPHCIITGQAGCRLGHARHGVVLGGQCEVRDHVTMADGTMAAACSGVADDVAPRRLSAAFPPCPTARRPARTGGVAALRDLMAQVRKFQEEVEKLKGNSGWLKHHRHDYGHRLFNQSTDRGTAALRCIRSSGIRRPFNDLARMQQMIDRADVTATASDGDTLVGVSRSLTDFCFSCYLSDLAVDRAYQRQGIGKELVRLTPRSHRRTDDAPAHRAPEAVESLKIGFTKLEADRGWIIKRPP